MPFARTVIDCTNWMAESSPWLDLNVTAPHRSKYNFDTVPYRLDFRDTKNIDQDNGELVLSLPRLESVFGRFQ